MEDDNDLLAVIKQINRLRKKAKFKRAKKKLIEELLLEEKYKEEDFYSEVLYESYLRNKDEIERELMQKYFDFDLNQMEELNRQAQEQVQNEEIKQKLEELGITDEKEQQEIAEKFKEEQQNDQSQEKNSDKSLNEKIIYAAAYKRTKDFGEQVEKQKEEQIKDKEIGISYEDGVKDIVDLKLLESLEKKYKKETGKDFSANKKVSELKDEFKDRTLSLQKQTMQLFEKDEYKRNKLEKKLQYEQNEYEKAIRNKNVNVRAYKEAYESKAYELASVENGINEQNEKILTEKKVEKEFDKNNFKDNVVIQNEGNKNENNRISDAEEVKKFEDNIKDTNKINENMDEKSNLYAKELREKREIDVLYDYESERKKASEVSTNLNDGKIDGVKYKSNIADVKKTINKNDIEHKKEVDALNSDFMNELKEQVRPMDERANDIVNEKNAEEKEEKIEEINERTERVLRQNRKTNKPGNNF